MACVELPKIPKIPSIKLLGGAEIKGVMDLSLGPPSDCRLTFSLLVQLAPLLASMACLFKILNVILKLKDFAEGATDPLNKLPKAVPGLLEAIGELTECIPPMQIPQLVIMIKGMLQLVVSFLNCFIEQLESIINFQAQIDFKVAEGNPLLIAELKCAKQNAQVSMDNLMLSLQPLEPIFKTLTMVAGIAQVPLKLPDLSKISAGQVDIQAISDLKQTISSLKQVVDSLPG
jgi:hypothetical protein